MPLYLSTEGLASVAIGICGRCSQKFPIGELMSDPNSPGLMVCQDDIDQYDPWRLPPRELEDITLRMPRPDVPLPMSGSPTSSAFGSFAFGVSAFGGTGYVSVSPGETNWPASQFPDDGLQANQLPATGNSS